MTGLLFGDSWIRLKLEPKVLEDLPGIVTLLLPGKAIVLDCTPHGRANFVVAGAVDIAIWVAGVDAGFRIGSRIIFFRKVRASIVAAVTEAAVADD